MCVGRDSLSTFTAAHFPPKKNENTFFGSTKKRAEQNEKFLTRKFLHVTITSNINQFF